MAEISAFLGSVFGFLFNILHSLLMMLYMPLWGVWNLFKLIGAGLGALPGKGRFKDRAIAAFTRPDRIRSIFAVLRSFLPSIVIRKKIITAYGNTGTALVTAFEDVQEVVNRDEIFQTTYKSKMALLTDGGNFFLGMQQGNDYLNNVSSLRLAANRNDIETIIVPFVQNEIRLLFDQTDGTLDVPQDLMKPVLARLVGHYFGTPGPSEDVMIAWTHTMFDYIFFDFFNKPETISNAQKASAECRHYLDRLIADRKEKNIDRDDVLGRCLKMQTTTEPFLDDIAIRNNILGLITAMLPTISNATTRVLDQLLDRPEELAGARQAALSGNNLLFQRYIVEAFRFNPMNPVIFRRATQAHILAAGTLRQRTIPEGCFVFAANLSAMFDPWVIPSPGRFSLTRSPDAYILWGEGLHKCFGEHMSRAIMPLFLKEIILRPNLRRAAGPAGKMDGAGTPFPQHLKILFD